MLKSLKELSDIRFSRYTAKMRELMTKWREEKKLWFEEENSSKQTCVAGSWKGRKPELRSLIHLVSEGSLGQVL